MRGPAELSGNHPAEMAYKSQIIGDSRDVDFSEFMWMQGDLEEFDRRVIEELLHEDSASETESYLDDVLEPDELAWYYNNVPSEQSEETITTDLEQLSLNGSRFIQYTLPNTNQLPVITQELNPNAAEFVPGMGNESESDDASSEGEKQSSEVNLSSFESRLNPEAPVFVPRSGSTSPPVEKEEER